MCKVSGYFDVSHVSCNINVFSREPIKTILYFKSNAEWEEYILRDVLHVYDIIFSRNPVNEDFSIHHFYRLAVSIINCTNYAHSSIEIKHKEFLQ